VWRIVDGEVLRLLKMWLQALNLGLEHVAFDQCVDTKVCDRMTTAVEKDPLRPHEFRSCKETTEAHSHGGAEVSDDWERPAVNPSGLCSAMEAGRRHGWTRVAGGGW
jgi:hypothetical protein